MVRGPRTTRAFHCPVLITFMKKIQMHHGYLRLGAAMAASVLLALSLSAQETLSVDVRLVNVVTTVTDESGRFVRDLRVDDFVVEEDGAPQRIAHLSEDQDTPVSIGILLDTSVSMANKIETAVAAVERFLGTLRLDDEVFLITFASAPVLQQGFTRDRLEISRALASIHTEGQTALYDALTAGLEKIRDGTHDKRALLVITDGQDNMSGANVDTVNLLIRRSEVLVYSLGIDASIRGGCTVADPKLDADDAPQVEPVPTVRPDYRRSAQLQSLVNMDSVSVGDLEAFALNSGGRAVLLPAHCIGGEFAVLEEVLVSIAEELGGQYTLGYYPSDPPNGFYQFIRVRTVGGHTVRARAGYFATK